MKTIICNCNHCGKPINENDEFSNLDDDIDVHKECLSEFWKLSINNISKSIKKIPEVKIKKEKNKYVGIFYEKRIKRWRGAARFYINGTDSDHFENLTYRTEEEALKDRQAKLITGKKLLDKVFKKFKIDKKIIIKGHYIDIVDIIKVSSSENIVEGTFGDKMDSRS